MLASNSFWVNGIQAGAEVAEGTEGQKGSESDEIEKVLDHELARLRTDRLRMKLHSEDRQ